MPPGGGGGGRRAGPGRAPPPPRDSGACNSIAVDVVAAPAAYVFGEDSCAVEFIESGNRKAQPRKKPPFPAEAGVGGQPTVVSNAETLAHLALVARHGAEWFR